LEPVEIEQQLPQFVVAVRSCEVRRQMPQAVERRLRRPQFVFFPTPVGQSRLSVLSFHMVRASLRPPAFCIFAGQPVGERLVEYGITTIPNRQERRQPIQQRADVVVLVQPGHSGEFAAAQGLMRCEHDLQQWARRFEFHVRLCEQPVKERAVAHIQFRGQRLGLFERQLPAPHRVERSADNQKVTRVRIQETLGHFGGRSSAGLDLRSYLRTSESRHHELAHVIEVARVLRIQRPSFEVFEPGQHFWVAPRRGHNAQPLRQPVQARGQHLDDGGPPVTCEGFVERVDQQVTRSGLRRREFG
jgi:hypothetical protein